MEYDCSYVSPHSVSDVITLDMQPYSGVWQLSYRATVVTSKTPESRTRSQKELEDLEVCYDAERVRTNTLRVRLHTCKVERSEVAVTTRHVPRSSTHMICDVQPSAALVVSSHVMMARTYIRC
jgi:hypothetical protein